METKLENDFSHFDEAGKPQMVDVTEKEETLRVAKARAEISMMPATIKQINAGTIKKGDVLSVATTAGILAAKQTFLLIPMCHPLLITGINISFELDDIDGRLGITSEVRLKGRTGAEMEALTAVTIAALTIYDMCKSVDRSMIVDKVMLIEKSGGKSGKWHRK